MLAATGDEIRKVWLFDSFAGLPKPDVKNYPQDEPDRLWTFNELIGPEYSGASEYQLFPLPASGRNSIECTKVPRLVVLRRR